MGSLHGYLRAALDSQIALHCLLWPFVFIFSHPKLRSGLRFKKQSKIRIVPIQNEDIVYFQALANQWNQIPKRV
uniref:Uncharacterized protein n=1 Tax=Panagrolaimus sp. PS1159 TaxID=55785 RepID=A0AC35F543_9BILA